VKVAQTENRRLMKLESKSQFTLMDENYLFESMGLTNATEEKLH